ncbi:MAG: hypothetical protein K6F05_09390 [Succinivibrio sp.]|nr:hypothetical protein [Succinivibrio sp.]
MRNNLVYALCISLVLTSPQMYAAGNETLSDASIAANTASTAGTKPAGQLNSQARSAKPQRAPKRRSHMSKSKPSLYTSPDGSVQFYEDDEQRIISLSKDPDPALFQNYHNQHHIKTKCAGLSEHECVDTYYDRKYYYEQLQATE